MGIDESAPTLAHGEPVAPPKDAHPLKAAVWMIGAIVSFTSMAVASRFTAVELDTFELMMYRSFLAVAIVLTVSTLAGTRRQITFRRMHLHFARNIFHFSGQNLWFFAMTVAPLAQVIALEFTAPLWVILFAPLLLDEHLTRIKIFSAALGFLGILIVARPDFGNVDVGVASALAAAIGFAGSMIFTKLLTRTETVTCILFWLSAMQAVFGVITAAWDGDVAVPSFGVLKGVAVVTVGGLGAHFSLTKALSLAPASLVGPMDFLRLPVIAVAGMVLFGESLDPLVFAGALLILGGNFFNIRASRQRR